MSYDNKTFYYMVSFDEPRGGPSYVPAASKEEAERIITEQYGHLKNFKIITVIDTSTIAPAQYDPTALHNFSGPETIN